MLSHFRKPLCESCESANSAKICEKLEITFALSRSQPTFETRAHDLARVGGRAKGCENLRTLQTRLLRDCEKSAKAAVASRVRAVRTLFRVNYTKCLRLKENRLNPDDFKSVIVNSGARGNQTFGRREQDNCDSPFGAATPTMGLPMLWSRDGSD